MAMSARKQASCSQKAILVYNVTAIGLVAMGVALLANSVEVEAHAGEQRWVDLAFAIAGLVVMAVALVAGILRKQDEDEYSRRLVGQAAMIGFFVATFAFVVWRPLANSWVDLPTGDQVLGLLFAGTGLGYFASRLFGVR